MVGEQSKQADREHDADEEKEEHVEPAVAFRRQIRLMSWSKKYELKRINDRRRFKVILERINYFTNID